MFGWLFGKKKPQPSPPTDKQLNYAARIGIAVPSGATRDELSVLIAGAEEANPDLRRQREHIKEIQRLRRHGPELLAREQQWEELSNLGKWLVAVHRSGQDAKAELLRINGAYITDKGKLIIETEAGKVIKDRYLGEIVDLGRYVALDPSKLLWSQVVDGFELSDVPRFRRTKEQAEKVARQFRKVAR